jgi:FkbM family methyltransferase
MAMTGFSSCTIAGLGPLTLPDVRCDRSQRPWWEAARLHCMHHYLEPGDRLLDVGSEMGDLSALFASWGVGVFLVEPNPKAWPWIASTFEANQFKQRVHGWYIGMLGSPKQAAESFETGLNEPHWLGDGMVWPESADDDLDEETSFYNLNEHTDVSPVMILDDLVEATGFVPTAITMDVEGGEYDVLQGALTVLARDRPKVWISVHPTFLPNYDAEDLDVHTLMRANGYDPVFLATDHEEHWMYLPQEYGWKY